ncbi:MAG: hypothetical protein Q8P51_07650 [Ignavibacteria bacterium]|nr:hypothetical protein [Ignavibacteria bacterium]
MTPQTSITSLDAENATKGSTFSLLAGLFIGGGIETEDSEPINDGGFKWLMALVIVAAIAFGCIVNGWLI